MMEAGTSAPPGLPNARLRLAYLNQKRELTLGALLGLTAAARVLGVPVAAPVLILVALWFVLASVFVQICGSTVADARLLHIEVGYFVLELGLITLLAHYAGAAQWLALLFYVITILYANMVLPAKLALWVTAAAAASFSGLVVSKSLGLIEDGSLLAG